MTKLNRFIIFISALILAACADDIEKMRLSDEERSRVLELQNPFGDKYIRFSVSGEESPVLLGMNECNIYQAKLERGVVTEWIKISELGSSYPFGSVCERQSIKYDGKYALFSYCKTALGAGGGCGGGAGNFRSINGREWEVLDGKNKWKIVENRGKKAVLRD